MDSSAAVKVSRPPSPRPCARRPNRAASALISAESKTTLGFRRESEGSSRPCRISSGSSGSQLSTLSAPRSASRTAFSGNDMLITRRSKQLADASARGRSLSGLSGSLTSSIQQFPSSSLHRLPCASPNSGDTMSPANPCTTRSSSSSLTTIIHPQRSTNSPCVQTPNPFILSARKYPCAGTQIVRRTLGTPVDSLPSPSHPRGRGAFLGAATTAGTVAVHCNCTAAVQSPICETCHKPSNSLPIRARQLSPTPCNSTRQGSGSTSVADAGASVTVGRGDRTITRVLPVAAVGELVAAATMAGSSAAASHGGHLAIPPAAVTPVAVTAMVAVYGAYLSDSLLRKQMQVNPPGKGSSRPTQLQRLQDYWP